MSTYSGVKFGYVTVDLDANTLILVIFPYSIACYYCNKMKHRKIPMYTQQWVIWDLWWKVKWIILFYNCTSVIGGFNMCAVIRIVSDIGFACTFSVGVSGFLLRLWITTAKVNVEQFVRGT